MKRKYIVHAIVRQKIEDISNYDTMTISYVNMRRSVNNVLSYNSNSCRAD
jgi:hypothetical protein